MLNETDNPTVEKLRNDLIKQVEVSNKLELLCLQCIQVSCSIIQRGPMVFCCCEPKFLV